MMTENQISKEIVDAALKVHKQLGPGLLESAYEECLTYELVKRKLFIERQKALPLVYEDVRVACVEPALFLHLAELPTTGAIESVAMV